jgi:hypothetical protein
MISFLWNQICWFESFGKFFHLESKSSGIYTNFENFQQNLLPTGKNSAPKKNLDWDERM